MSEPHNSGRDKGLVRNSMHGRNYTAGRNAPRMISIHEQREHRHMRQKTAGVAMKRHKARPACIQGSRGKMYLMPLHMRRCADLTIRTSKKWRLGHRWLGLPNLSPLLAERSKAFTQPYIVTHLTRNASKILVEQAFFLCAATEVAADPRKACLRRRSSQRRLTS